MGLRLENPKANDLPMPKIPCLERDSMKPTNHSSFGIEQENPRRNVMILNQETDFTKPKFFMDHPYGISTSTRAGEQENPKTNGLILQQ